MTAGALLRRIREEKGLTRRQLGALIYYDHRTVWQWENGVREIDLSIFLTIVRTLEMEWILLG